MQFARALQETLDVGPYIQIIVRLPMIHDGEERVGDMGSLGRFAREQYLDQMSTNTNLKDDLGSWDAWNTIRTICKYHVRLLVGKTSATFRALSPMQKHLLRVIHGDDRLKSLPVLVRS